MEGTENIRITRQPYTKVKFDETFQLIPPTIKSTKDKFKDFIKENYYIRPLTNYLPFLNTLRTYEWKNWIVKDLIAGLTVGVMHVPQSMGFAVLTGVPPVCGLYSTFFPVLLYFFLGTSRHISVGTMAVISLMIGTTVQRQAAQAPVCIKDNDAYDLASCNNFKIGIATSVSLISSIFQILMSLLQLGVITRLMSNPFVGGFTAGATFHIVTSQVKFMLGLKNLKGVSGMFKLPITYINIVKIIDETNLTELAVYAIAMLILIFIKDGINEAYKHKLKIPIPAEIVVVILAVLITHFGLKPSNVNIKIIGELPRGFPVPSVPSMDNATSYIVDSFLVALIGFVISFSLAKLFSDKYNYTVDTNQELLAYGLCYGVGSFFSSFAGAVAPPRCFAHESIGGKTQLAGVFASSFVLLVIVALGPLFQSLPNSVLAAIIVAALVPVFKSFTILKPLWRVNKCDFYVWVVTWLSVTLLDISIGLAIGIAVAVMMPGIHSMFLAKGAILGKVPHTELYAPIKAYKQPLTQLPGICIYRFEYPLFYITAEKFKRGLFMMASKPEVPISSPANEHDKAVQFPESPPDEAYSETLLRNMSSLDVIDIEAHDTVVEKKKKPTTLKLIILDLTAVTYLDIIAINMLKAVAGEYKKVDIKLAMVTTVQDVLLKCKKTGIAASMGIYPSIEDAVVHSNL